MAISASIIPGKVFEEGEAVNISTLNLLGNPTVNIEGAVSGLGIEDDSITDAKVNSVAAIATSKLALSSAIEVDGTNVGIGCTPSFKLHCVADAANWGSYIRNSNAAGYGLLVSGGKADGTTDAFQVDDVAGTTLLTLQGDGSLGLGTSAPAYKTQIVDSSDCILSVVSGTSSKASLYLGDAVATRGRIEYDNDESGSTPDSLSLWSNNARAITIDDSQNVGIATDSPTAKLTVAGAIAFDASVNGVINTENSIRINIDSDNSGTGESFIVGHNQTAIDQNNVLFKVQEDGNCGIGCTPSYPLHVAGADDQYIAIQNTGADSTGGYILYNDARTWTMRVDGADSDKFQIRDGTADAQRLTIDSSGNIGLGTDSPSAKLDCQGNAKFNHSSSNLQVDFTANNSTVLNFTNGTSEGTALRTDEYFRFDTGGSTERMRIDASGNVILANVQEGSSGLASGTIYKDSGFLKIVA